MNPPEIAKILSDIIRWNLVQALQIGDLKVKELSLQFDIPMNLVSYHLKILKKAEIVTSRRSEADARDIYYSLNIAKLKSLYTELGIAMSLNDDKVERDMHL